MWAGSDTQFSAIVSPLIGIAVSALLVYFGFMAVRLARGGAPIEARDDDD
jgi:hypothetical protein